MNANARQIVAQLGLQPLPHEGGYFARIWTSGTTLGPMYRPAGTAIHFLLTPDSFSALHRLDADEFWHFHAGDPIEHVQFTADRVDPTLSILGNELARHHSPQLLVPAGTWQGARIAETRNANSHGWSLVGCTMCPGWDPHGFELGSREFLTARFPENASLIEALTRKTPLSPRP